MARGSILIEKHELLYGLETVRRATSQTFGILSNVRLTTEGHGLRVSATDMLIGVTTWVPATAVVGELDLAVRLEALDNCVQELPSSKALVTQDETSSNLRLQSGPYDVLIKGQDVQDTPAMPFESEGDSKERIAGRIKASALRDVADGVVVAAATENSRPVLTSVHIEFDGLQATFVAADGFRLAAYQTILATAVPKPISFNMPTKAIQEIARLGQGRAETLEFQYSSRSGQMRWCVGSVQVTGRPVQGTYPDHRNLIPNAYSTRLVATHSELKSALGYLAGISNYRGIVRLHFSARAQRAFLRSVEREDDIPRVQIGLESAEGSGDDNRVALHTRYLSEALDTLASTTTTEIALEISGPTQPVVIRPAIEPPDHSYLHVVMPMFVDWEVEG